MEKTIFTRDEFKARFELEEDRLREWEEAGLLKPAGFTDEKTPLYSEAMGERVGAIRKFVELGYETAEVQKILKKVGLPKAAEQKRKIKGPHRYLTVGNLAERVGLSPRTIKHWEDKGIIEADMRSEGGFRLYSGGYVLVCELIRDLQLFGYSLDEIKEISDSVRAFLAIQGSLESIPPHEVSAKLEEMLQKVDSLLERMEELKKGLKRWEDLVKKKRKEISELRAKNLKRVPRKPKGKK
jgi:DNA-binding transcriptional MerR regulator